ncbi:putative E3 ubiquitin-protein ligase RZFP34 [Tasmannia lanceolata]|uniref:putative E3 ubiquitin-protein ligase RZFP34 n=1 Tax=Tasmannia lanceolata TaxID=3420 RepID=UPI0040644FF0
MEVLSSHFLSLGNDEPEKHEVAFQYTENNEPEILQQTINKDNETRTDASCSQLSCGECMPTEQSIDDLNMDPAEKQERGYMEYGCSHYRRRCRIRAPCCNEIFDCRHCHNEAKNSINVERMHRHDLPRHQVRQVICSLCGTEQDVRQICINCGVCMGKYFCETCKLFDDDTSKEQYHCNGCGICRIGGRENFAHCFNCGCCYSVLYNGHPCVERAMHHDCPVCFEYLFESTSKVSVLPCGHTIHMNCLKEMQEHSQYACPLCSKSVCDMSKVWEKIDMEIAAIPMPESYQNKMVWILCNDCGANSQVQFHIVAQKCLNCKSYNTRQTSGLTDAMLSH